jgi:bifunctional non-homologous end joining protein LigD
MLAKSSPPFDSERFLFELKWDGTRCIAFVESTAVRLQNRRLLDITRRYPEFRALKDHLKARSAVLDGEIVVLEQGVPKFHRLQQRDHIEDAEKIQLLSGLIPATYVVFDLLYLNRQSLMGRPLTERRDLLKGLFPYSGNIVFSESFSEGKGLFSAALRKGFEGIMAKDRSSPYLPGERSGYWLKIKKAFDIDAVVCGYLEGEGSRKRLFGSLILGMYRKKGLVHIGQVGTGLSEETMDALSRRLAGIRTEIPPLDVVPELKRRAFWCRPEIVVRVSFQDWTREGRLRVPVFKGIRDDKEPEECSFDDRRETPETPL